jgi:hypothetical protein
VRCRGWMAAALRVTAPRRRSACRANRQSKFVGTAASSQAGARHAPAMLRAVGRRAGCEDEVERTPVLSAALRAPRALRAAARVGPRLPRRQ